MSYGDPVKPSVAVAIPAYNEADGIGGFLTEIDRALAPHTRELVLVVVDDGSTDDTVAVVESVRESLTGRIELIASPLNRGHGPTLLAAYGQALALSPDFVLQVDGDGQFHGSDLRRVLVLLNDDAHAVCGVRRFRADPWFRMAMTRLVRVYVNAAFHVLARDANCPLRGYDAAVLADLLQVIPPDALVPNLYLTVVASRRGLALLEVDVSHRVRRGRSAEGSGLGRAGRSWSPVPMRLVRFSLNALVESRGFRHQMDTPGWARDIVLPERH